MAGLRCTQGIGLPLVETNGEDGIKWRRNVSREKKVELWSTDIMGGVPKKALAPCSKSKDQG